MSENWGRFVVYVDESGDHTLAPTDSEYPVFVLAFCIFDKHEYLDRAVPDFVRFKFAQFGHDMVVFHEREIRKSLGVFSFLLDAGRRDRFMSGLTTVMANSPFKLIASVIRKDQLPAEVIVGGNPYHIALRLGLDRLCEFLSAKDSLDVITHVVFEQRGATEDNELELEFRRYCDGDNERGCPVSLVPVFASKRCNSSGLQLADLVARPIGRRIMQPTQFNRAFEVIRGKLVGDPLTDEDGLQPGLIVCP